MLTTAVFSVMVESARIARGAVKPLSELTPDSADAVVIPGGFGAAKNLCDFGFKVSGQWTIWVIFTLPMLIQGGDMTVSAEAERVISGFHGAGKPLALCCISPILAAKVSCDWSSININLPLA